MNNTASDEMEKKSPPGLSPLNAWALAFGCIIGWGAFVMPGTTFLPAAGPVGTAISMAIGTIVMLVIGYNFHHMMCRPTGAGGPYAYAREAFGRDQAFLCAWFLGLSYIALIPQNASALALISRYFFRHTLQFGFHYQVAGYDVYCGELLLSEAVLVLFALPFLFRERIVRHLQTLAALAIVIGVAVVLCAGMVQGDLTEVGPAFGMTGLSPGLGVTTIVLLAPWAFLGFETLSLVTRDFRFPCKKSFPIIAASIVAGGVVYGVLAWIAAAQIPAPYGSWQAYLSDLQNLEGLTALPTFHASGAILSRTGVVLLAIAAFGAIVGGIVGFYWAAGRLLTAMAEDGILPEPFRRNRVCILFIMGISMLAPFFGRTALSWIVDTTSIGAVIGFGYTSAAAWHSARREGRRLPVITGALGTVISVVFATVLLVPHLIPVGTMASESYLVLALWSILGFAFYWRTLRVQLGENSIKSLRIGIVLLLLVVFSSLFWVRQSSEDNTRQILENLNNYNDMELSEHGITLTETERADSEYYLQKQMGMVNDTLWRSTFIQVLLLLAALLCLWKVYQIIMDERREMELQKLQAEERSKAKSALLFNMSHDIRTPMNAILGFAALARREENLSPQAAAYLEKIETSGQSLMTLLNDVLEMSNIESGKLELSPEKTDLRKVMEEARELFSKQMSDKQIVFHVETEGLEDPWVLCDKNRLGIILFQLLSNACKFTPEGGEVRTSLTQTGSEDGQGRYLLRVRDNGIGMSADFAAKIYDAFERERTSTDSGLQGMGLGMTMTKRIVERMGGEIQIDTAPGQGTEFRILLSFPLEQPPEEAPQADSEPFDFSGRRLLLVEDIELNREIAVMLLEEEGFTVDEAENGQIAVDMMKDAPAGTYDAILMDLQMPVMNGFEATRVIRAMEDPDKADIPIIAVTANTSDEDRRETREAGMNGHVPKPLDMDQLLDVLAKVCKRG